MRFVNGELDDKTNIDTEMIRSDEFIIIPVEEIIKKRNGITHYIVDMVQKIERALSLTHRHIQNNFSENYRFIF